MAGKRFSLGEVMDGLDGSDFEDDSEDDFDGYDMDDEFDSDEELREEDGGERRGLRVHESVGAEVEVASGDMDESDSVPDYTQQAGCSTPMEGESPIDFFSLLFTDSMLHHIVAQTNRSSLSRTNLLHTQGSGAG